MRLLLFFYLILTVLISGRMLFHEAVWGGVALFFGSLLGFVGGSGMRGALYVGQRSSAVIIGGALAFAGMALVFYSGVIIGVFGWSISGDLWVALGFGLGFFAARPEDAPLQVNPASDEDDVALGLIAPIAAAFAAGRLTAEQAEDRIRDLALTAPRASALWQTMSAIERAELGRNFMLLASDPDFAAKIEKQLDPMKQLDPELWEQSLAKARDELGYTDKGEDT